jgi:hypothetical protein
MKIPNRIPKLFFCRFINWHLWYPVWYLYCFVVLSIDTFGILFGIFIVLSVHQLTTLVFCLVSLLVCRFINWQVWYPVWYLYCFIGPSIDTFDILFGIFNTKGVNWWTDKTIKIPNRIPKLSIDEPTKQWRYQTGSQRCQLMDRQNNKDTTQDTKPVNWWTDKTMKIPNRIPKLSIDESTNQ